MNRTTKRTISFIAIFGLTVFTLASIACLVVNTGELKGKEAPQPIVRVASTDSNIRYTIECSELIDCEDKLNILKETVNELK
jgi:hypothetical protein